MRDLRGISLGIAVVFFSLIFFTGLVFIFLNYAPPNPLTPQIPISWSSAFRQAVPEGWAFFTKSQRDPYYEIYRISGTQLTNVFDGPQSEPGLSLGFLRLPRAEGLEIGMMIAQDPRAMVKCSDTLANCIKLKLREVRVKSSATAPIYCGRFVVVAREPIPFSWSSFRHVTMEMGLERVSVECK